MENKTNSVSSAKKSVLDFGIDPYGPVLKGVVSTRIDENSISDDSRGW